MHGNMQKHARVAQLVERDLAKVEAAGSSPVSRSFITRKRSIQEDALFLYHKIFSDRQVVSGWNVKVTTEVGNYIDYFVCVSLE